MPKPSQAEEPMKIKDKRRWSEDYKHEDEVCRVCGDIEVHSTQYNKPTMACVDYLRSEINRLIKLKVPSNV